MALINTILNTFDCSTGAAVGTGTAHCKFNFTNMSGGGVGFLKKGVALPTDITQASLIALQQSGDLIILKGMFSIEDQGSDDQVETSESGIEVLGTKGLMKYMVSFTNGVMYQRALASLESNGRYETILWDAAGNVLCREDVNGNARGFTTGQILVSRPVLASGGTAAKQSLSFQWTRIKEYNDNVSYLDSEQLAAEDVDFLDLDGVNELEITLDPVIDLATSVTGNIVSAFDGKLTDTTLTDTDFLFVKNGVEEVFSSININQDGSFTLDLSPNDVSLDDVLELSLNGIVKNASDVLYKSNTAKTVVIA